MHPAFRYTRRARRPAMMAAFITTLVLTAVIAWLSGLSAALLGGAGVALAWALFVHPGREMRLENGVLAWNDGRFSEVVPISTISKVALRRRGLVGSACRLTLSDGRIVTIPSGCLPAHRVLEREFAARGLPITSADGN
ncbi:MAG: hypothetical protein AAF771_11145 [Pseudomonadota bacterium]